MGTTDFVILSISKDRPLRVVRGSPTSHVIGLQVSRLDSAEKPAVDLDLEVGAVPPAKTHFFGRVRGPQTVESGDLPSSNSDLLGACFEIRRTSFQLVPGVSFF